MSAQTYQFSLGNFTITMLNDLPDETNPVERFFPAATPEERAEIAERYDITDELTASHTTMLIQTDTQTILTDAGWGTHDDGRQGQLLEALASIDVQAHDIDIVILTHAHGDHYLGLLDSDNHKVFPNARYLMHHAEWEYYSSDEYLSQVDDTRREYMQKHFLPLRDSIDCFGEDNPQIAEGITMLPAYGHTKYHIALEVNSEGETLIATTDCFIHPMHFLYPHWAWEFEYDKEALEASRKMLIEKILEKNAIVTAYHFAFPAVGKLTRETEQLIWQPHEA